MPHSPTEDPRISLRTGICGELVQPARPLRPSRVEASSFSPHLRLPRGPNLMTASNEPVVIKTANQIVNLGVDGVGPIKPARVVADECLIASRGDVEDAVARAVRLHVRYATTSGAVTGLGGIVTLPLTLTAGIATSYVINARMVSTVAHLRGYDVASEEVRTVILATLLGASGANAVQQAGVQIGNKTLLAAVRKVPGKALIDVNKRVGFRLVTKAGSTGVVNLTKLVPLVGAPIGATAERLVTRAVGRYALQNFPPLPPIAESDNE